MAARRGSRRGGSQAQHNRRGASSRIRKNMRNRQAPRRYGQNEEPEAHQSDHENTPESSSNGGNPREYEYSTPSNNQNHCLSNDHQSTHNVQSQSPSPVDRVIDGSSPHLYCTRNESISIDDMRELLRSHEKEIVDRVILQLRTKNPSPTANLTSNSPISSCPPNQQQKAHQSIDRIADLEHQLAQL